MAKAKERTYTDVEVTARLASLLGRAAGQPPAPCPYPRREF